MIWVNKVYSSLISSSWSFISSHLLLLYFLISNIQFLKGPSLLLLSRLNFIDTFHFFILPMIWQNMFAWCTQLYHTLYTPRTTVMSSSLSLLFWGYLVQSRVLDNKQAVGGYILLSVWYVDSIGYHSIEYENNIVIWDWKLLFIEDVRKWLNHEVLIADNLFLSIKFFIKVNWKIVSWSCLKDDEENIFFNFVAFASFLLCGLRNNGGENFQENCWVKLLKWLLTTIICPRIQNKSWYHYLKHLDLRRVS